MKKLWTYSILLLCCLLVIGEIQAYSSTSTSTTFTVNNALVATIVSTTDVACNGDSTGAIDLMVTGGTAPYQYSWRDSNNSIVSTLEDPIALTAGTYTAMIIDANDTITITATINESSKIVITETITNILCNGAATGAIDVTVTGGTPTAMGTYTYNWSNGATTSTISGLVAGTYNVTVTDGSQCSLTKSIEVTQPTALMATAAMNKIVSCFGGNDGSAIITATGGIAPYTYNWDNGEQTVEVTNLAAGTYTPTITDANNCTTTATVVITEPSLLSTSTATIADVLCFGGANGVVSVTATGGTTPYAYNWSNGAANSKPTNLVAGTYNITVTDGNQCISVNSVTVTQPTALVATASVVNEITCNGATDGSVMVNVTGGTGNYTYQWATGETTTSLNNLGAGTYTVVVTDGNNCSTTASVTVGQPALLTAIANLDADVTCNGGNNGRFTVTAAGGTAPYQYQLNGGTAQGTGVFTGLMAGIYNVTVTDANGCTTMITQTISEPSAMNINSTTTDVNCNGEMNGSATITVVGGTAPYTYAWSNTATTANIVNVAAGVYMVTVTDANNCTQTASVTINQPAVLAATTMMNTAVSCFGGNDGSATITAIGGTAPYNYVWGNGEQTAQAMVLTAGIYTPTITDANGCMTTATIMITEPTALNATASTTANVSCLGGADGSATVAVTGGTTPYTYMWSNGMTTTDLANVMTGIYTVTVTDANGCTTTSSTTVTEPTALQVTSTTNDVSCNGGNDGSATLTVTGGSPITNGEYTYTWSNSATTANVSNLGAGTYTVTVADMNNCSTTHSLTINEPMILSAIAGNTTGISCFGATDGSIFVSVQGGTIPYTYTWSNGATTANVSNLGAGTYTVIVTDANNCSTTASTTITGPTEALTATITNITDLTCNGANDGTIDLTVSGGITPYTYSWTNGATTEDITGLDVGSYGVTVTDASGCVVTIDTSLSEPAQLSAVVTSSLNFNGYEVSCNGAMDGAIDLQVTGGTPIAVGTYTYAWATGETTEDLTNLGAGTYSVVVTDANNCSVTTSITLTEPSSLSATITNTTNVTCNGANDGSAMATATGGVAPYSYAWDSVQMTSMAMNLSVGTHTVTVTDANGCVTTATATITEPMPVTVSLNTTQLITCNGGTGDIAAIVAGGTAPYAYTWSNGMTTADLTGVGAGIYTLTVIDANNCTTTQSITLSEPMVIVANINSTDVSCNGQADGAADLTVSGGTAPYTFAWDNNQTTEDLTGLAVGTYGVVITDANGCTATATTTIAEPTALTATAMAMDATCNGSTGSVSLTVTGGTAPYTYAWDNSSTMMNLMQVSAGTYNVMVTDANGCTAMASAVVGEPTAITVTSTVTNVTCNGQADGAINITVTGGIPIAIGTYFYDWGGGITTQNLSNVAAGTYTVMVTDGNGCTMMHTATVTEPDVLTVTGTTTNITCNGQADGTIMTTVLGGTAPYTYNWSNTSNAANLTGLGVGTYDVMVTDANGCQANATFQVTEPATLSLTVTAQDIVCNGGTTSLNSLVSGGTTPYTVSVTDAAGAAVIDPNSVTAGTYTVSVTDANGCSTNQQVTLTEPTAITINSLIVEDVLCAGEATGSILLDVMGGAGTYTYNWSTSQGVNNNANNLTAGNYSVTVTDFNGCMVTGSFTINEPAPLTLSLSGVDDPNNSGKVELTATAGGGVAPYTYNWSGNAAGQTGSVASNIASGVFTVVVTDANGCSVEATETVIATGTETLTNVSKLSLFPNPTVGQATIELELTEAADVNIAVYNVAGIKVQEFGNEYTSQARHQMDLTQFVAGVYLVRVTIDSEVVTKRLVVVRP